MKFLLTNKFYYSFFLCLFYLNVLYGLPQVIRIGALFEEGQLEQQLVFHAAIQKINDNFSNRTIFEPVIRYVGNANSFEANFKSKFDSLFLSIKRFLLLLFKYLFIII